MAPLPPQFSEQLLHSIPEPLIVIDAENFGVVFANAEAESQYGYITRGTTTCYRLTHQAPSPCDQTGEPCPLTRIRQTGQSVRLEHVHYDDNGSSRYFLVQAAPIRNETGEIQWILETHTDITDQKAEWVHRATHDPLTGLLNRGALEALIEREIARQNRGGAPFSLALLDVDCFKTINDEHGHHFGDQVLQGLVRAWCGRLRASDTLGRWGGEEFLVLLPETNLEGAQQAAEELRRISEELVFPGNVRVSISAGVAEHGTKEDLLNVYWRVDEALYEAKRLGRNRIVGSDGTVESRKQPYGPLASFGGPSISLGPSSTDPAK